MEVFSNLISQLYAFLCIEYNIFGFSVSLMGVLVVGAVCAIIGWLIGSLAN